MDGEWVTQDPETVAADPGGAWAAALLGTALGVYVDRTLNAPQSIASSGAYGIDANGNMYTMGKPTTTVAMTPVAGKGTGNLLLLLLIGFAVMEMRK